MTDYDINFPGLPIPIRKVQDVQLEIFREFDRFCRLHDLKYVMYAGTLLGSVRHQGFIPWDDDIDVVMPREDYERFLKLKDEFSESFYIQNFFIDSSIFSFSKIKKNNTTMLPRSNQRSDVNQGIWIDVFPVDVTSSNKFKRWYHLNVARFLFVLTTSSEYSKVKSSRKGFNRFFRFLFYIIQKITGTKIWFKLFEKNNKKFVDDENLDGYYYSLTGGNSYRDQSKFRLPSDTFNDRVELDFEGEMFYAPKNYHQILNNFYGDYKKWPSRQERAPHHDIVVISFDNETFYRRKDETN